MRNQSSIFKPFINSQLLGVLFALRNPAKSSILTLSDTWEAMHIHGASHPSSKKGFSCKNLLK